MAYRTLSKEMKS